MMTIPSYEMVMRWLQNGRIEHYICDQCHGIHIVALQSLDGVQESRLFVDDEGLLFSTELELRPSSIFPMLSMLGDLNMNYPNLKIFLDVSDDNLPRLIVGHTVFTKAGLSFEQFMLFVNSTISSTHEVINETERQQLLNLPQLEVGGNAIH